MMGHTQYQRHVCWQVFKATRLGTTDVAVKLLNFDVTGEAGAHQMHKEIAILRKVSYDRNVVQFFGACFADPAMLVMEYMAVRKLLKAGRNWQMFEYHIVCRLLM